MKILEKFDSRSRKGGRVLRIEMGGGVLNFMEGGVGRGTTSRWHGFCLGGVGVLARIVHACQRLRWQASLRQPNGGTCLAYAMRNRLCYGCHWYAPCAHHNGCHWHCWLTRGRHSYTICHNLLLACIVGYTALQGSSSAAMRATYSVKTTNVVVCVPCCIPYVGAV